jgi:ribosomal protein L11 methyltransferase
MRFGPVAIQEHDAGDGWRVFFRSPADRDRARGALSSEFGNALLVLEPLEVDDGDWARRSQATLTPIRVGRITVVPPWHVPDRIPDPGSRIPDPDLITIVIDPSTGFGTGHHASTRLCLELLQKQNLHGARVLDVGTGSGVLALAAWKLGAAHVTAIDNDPDALANARDNVVANGAADAITIEQFDLSSVSLGAVDLVVANLTGALLQRHASALRTLVTPGGVLIVSGFTVEEQQEVAQALTASVQETASEGDWRALVITHQLITNH